MNTQQIEYLREAVKAGSFSRAADALNSSQSILSRQVAALEQELGCELLRRHGRGVVQTPAGSRLLELSDVFLRGVAQLKSSDGGTKGELKGEFTLGVPMFFSKSIAPLLMACVRRTYPGVTFLIREGHSGDVVKWLLASELSAAVLYDSKRPRHLSSDDLFLEPFCVVGSVAFAREHKLDLNSALSISQLAQFPLIMPTRRHGTRLDLERIMERNQLLPNFVCDVDALGARMLLVREGLGVTIFESSALEDARVDPSLFVLPMAETCTHKLVWVDGREQSRGPKWRAFVRDITRDIVSLHKQVTKPL